MQSFGRKFGTLIVVFITMALVGCGSETATIADTTRPIVTATTPAAGAIGVSLTPLITATFSKAMNPAIRRRLPRR